MSRPLCSILITTKNGGTRGSKYGLGKWFREALNSALRQTHPEVEICIHDDASDDQVTKEIIREYIESGKGRVQAITSRDHSGIAKGFNLAFEISSGERVFPLGDDDILAPTYIEEILAHIERKRELKGYALDLCGTWINEITPEGLFWNQLAGKETEPVKIRICMDRNRFECGVLSSSREAWEKIGGYPEDMEMASDYGFALGALENKLLIGCVPQCLYFYRSTYAGNRENYSFTKRPIHLRLVVERFEIYRRRSNPFYERNAERGLLSPTVSRRNLKETLRK